MKKVLVIPVVFALLLLCFLSIDSKETVQIPVFKNSTPPNEGGIAKSLILRGEIDKNLPKEQIEAAVRQYIKKKLVPQGKNEEQSKKMLSAVINKKKNVGMGNMIRGLKRGKRRWDLDSVSEQPYTGEVRTAKLLILLAEFGPDQYDIGPLHNEIPRPDPVDNTSLWVNDFSPSHYESMLFTPGGYDAVDQNGEILHLDSMVDFYQEQSNGSYLVDGHVYGWFTLPHSEAYYGDDNPAGGHDNLLPGTPRDLVADLLQAAVGTVPFEQYDVEDPYDLNGNGNYDEPDGIIDHLVIVHAGIDQSGGGGAQGDNAIWAHSSSVFEYIPVDNPPVDYWNGNMLAYNYIIQGEDGGIGVFCHEFAHDIGLPDEYDTIYSGSGEPVGFYSLMSSGSWTGKPLGTKPAPISVWGRMILGQIWGGQWVVPTVVDSDTLTRRGEIFDLDQTVSKGLNHQALKINLPTQMVATTLPHQGSYEFYGGRGDEIDHTMATTISLPAAGQILLDFWTWYDIEENWDFGFVQVSTDGGATWQSLASSRTTDTIVPDGYPAIQAQMPGYTGSSGGWVNEVIDISAYAGMNIMLQFRYMTDWSVTMLGFFVDDVKVIADGTAVFQDDAENGFGQWTADGWTITNGYEAKGHYYMVEWRNPVKTDQAMLYAYNWVDYARGIVEYYRQEPGMLLWYRNLAYVDNWVGVHPGYGFLGVVDSHPQPMMAQGLPVRTRIQIHDAAFSYQRVPAKTFTFGGQAITYPSRPGVPLFNDRRNYWRESAPDAGLILPDYGIKIMVLNTAGDFTTARIGVFK